MSEGGREGGGGVRKGKAKGEREVGEEGWEMVYRRVEVLSKVKEFQGWREVVHRVIEILSKS